MSTTVGTLGGITEKPSGWFEISVVTPDKQYPLRLDTKKQELVELARAAGQSVMVWSYTEKDSDKINEHTGKPYVNRYFEGVTPLNGNEADATVTQSAAKGGLALAQQLADSMQTTAADAFPPRSSDGMSKDEWAHKDSAIHMMACIKTAADALKHTMPSEPKAEDLRVFIENVKTLSHNWHLQVDAVRKGDDSDIPFLSAHDDAIPY